MNERIKREGQLDHGVALEVAHSAKELRDEAALVRRVDEIVASYHAAEDNDPTALRDYVARIIGANAVYPDVFSNKYGIIGQSGNLDDPQLLSAASSILRADGVREGRNNSIRVPENVLDERASEIEQITESLLTHPPSRDFMEAYDIGEKCWTPSLRIYQRLLTVDEVLRIKRGITYNEKQLMSITSNIEQHAGYYQNVNTDQFSPFDDKLEALRYMFEAVTFEIKKNPKNMLAARLAAAKNLDTTTIGNLYEIWMGAVEGVLESYREEIARERGIIDAIFSGEAANYRKPDNSDE